MVFLRQRSSRQSLIFLVFPLSKKTGETEENYPVIGKGFGAKFPGFPVSGITGRHSLLPPQLLAAQLVAVAACSADVEWVALHGKQRESLKKPFSFRYRKFTYSCRYGCRWCRGGLVGGGACGLKRMETVRNPRGNTLFLVYL